MKKNYLILFFLIFSKAAFAENCTFVILGGSKPWLTILPGLETDLSIDVGNEIIREAKKTGCEILTLANDTEESFIKNLKKLKEPPFNRPGMKYHFSFADHGTGAQNDVNKSYLITGMGHYITYEKFISTLKESLPQKARVTFDSSNCYPNFSEALIATKLESHFNICGSSSTSKNQMSWNLRTVQQTSTGKSIGPYGAIGLTKANEYKNTAGVFPTVSQFHYLAKAGDYGNIGKQPGTSTSLSFVNLKLAEYKLKSAMPDQDLIQIMSYINWSDSKATDLFLKKSLEENISTAENYLDGSCMTRETNPYTNYLSYLAGIYHHITQSDYSTLPSPYSENAKRAQNFLKQHQKNLTVLIAKFAREVASIKQANRNSSGDKYIQAEKQIDKLLARQNEELAEYQFNLRLLQEAKNVKTFIENAPKADYERFMNFLNCENLPML